MKRLALTIALMLSGTTANADLEQLRAAAQAGNVESQLELGELYEFGFTLPQNKIPAYVWYTIAAERGNAKAEQRRDLLKSKMSSAELSEAERQRAALAPIPAAPTPAPNPREQAPSTSPDAAPISATPTPSVPDATSSPKQ